MRETLSDLEGDICDIRDMSDLATQYVEDVVSSLLSEDRKKASFGITEHEGRLILFCIYQLNSMTRDLRDRFFTLLKQDGVR